MKIIDQIIGFTGATKMGHINRGNHEYLTVKYHDVIYRLKFRPQSDGSVMVNGNNYEIKELSLAEHKWPWKSVTKKKWLEEHPELGPKRKEKNQRCPTCDQMFASLKSHKCPADLSLEGMKKNWEVRVKLLPLGNMINPDTDIIGMTIAGDRSVPKKKSRMGFRTLIIGEKIKKVYTYCKSQEKFYHKEVDYIVENWANFAEAEHPVASFDKSISRCGKCGAAEISGISEYTHGGSYNLCVCCMFEMIGKWCESPL